jgi:hypothetical protein
MHIFNPMCMGNFYSTFLKNVLNWNRHVICLSVTYFLAVIAPRELNESMMLSWYLDT